MLSWNIELVNIAINDFYSQEVHIPINLNGPLQKYII